jgi:hypothetical protein
MMRSSEYKSGEITTIANAAVLDLTGPARVADAAATGRNSALEKLASNAGTLAVDAGAVLLTAVAMSNTGVLDVDTIGAGGSSLTIGRMLANGGTFDIGNSSLSSATTVAAAGSTIWPAEKSILLAKRRRP